MSVTNSLIENSVQIFDANKFFFFTNTNRFDNDRLADLLLLSSEQLARRVISLYLRVNELSNAIQLSKEHMEKLRNENQKVVRNEKQASQARLKEQKTQYESIVARHQGFIEQVSVR